MAADSSTSAFRVTASSDILRFRFPFSRIWSHEIQSRKSKIGENLENEYARSVFIPSCLVFSHKSGRAFTLQISRAPKSLQSNEMPASALSWQRPSRDRLRRPEWHNRSALSRCVTEAQVHDTLTRPVYHSFDLSRAGSFAARSIRRSSEVAVHRHLVFFGNPRLFAVAFGTGTRAARARQAKNARINDNVS